MHVIKRDGSREPFDFSKIERLNEFATKGLNVNVDLLKEQIRFLAYDGMKTSEIFQAQVSAASGLISKENQDFTFVAARYLLAELYKRVGQHIDGYGHIYSVIERGVDDGRYSDRMFGFEFDKLQAAIKPERDFQFDYFGLQNVVDRYLMRLNDQTIIELPQQFFMRVAMGLALNEDKPTERAIEFYEVLSQFDFMASTPTLFNSGTVRSQLSSCYLNIVDDQISAEDGENRYASIYGTIEECARLSKYAGGIGTSWTRVRGVGSHIKGTNGRSSGTVPYLKVYNDTAVAVNQGGKRKGSFAPYMEPWHPDFLEFCELKREFGDERQRAHDIFPAAWLPDLFMKRVTEGGVWSFFDPAAHPALHELYGDDFELLYCALEARGKFVKQLPAQQVWKTILTMLFETGHPWVTFKDECNRRSPQQHVGVVHSSNLCTEITLNTSSDETAVCNLGSVNLGRHVTPDGRIDHPKLQRTIRTAVRMLDNVIDLNYYPSARAKKSNLRHRPIGLGQMGLYEALVKMGVAYDTFEGVEADSALSEAWSYYAIAASAELARERGSYETFEGSTWEQGILPHMSAKVEPIYSGRFNWELLAAEAALGMRNSNVMAIAPTATISIITFCTPCTEPPFELERSEKNISGQFKVVDPCLRIGRPELVKTVWDIEPIWLIEHGSRRQVWIDQSQSTNIFVKAGTRGRDLAELYMAAWQKGLKTTYYLRTQSKTVAAAPKPTAVEPEPTVDLCSIDNPDCEACQ
jgi:ribonucleoside-diphosphate reductase alpha chain